MNFISFIMFGICSVCLFVVSGPFVSWWLKGAEYDLGLFFAFLLSLDFYIFGITKVTSSFRTSLGLFQHAKYRPVIGALVNIVVSIALVGPLGIQGVMLGTIIANLGTYLTVDPRIIFNKGFEHSARPFYVKNLCYFLTILSCGAISYFVSTLLPFSGLVYVLLAGILTFSITAGIFLLLFHRTEEFAYTIRIMRKIVARALGRLRGATSA